MKHRAAELGRGRRLAAGAAAVAAALAMSAGAVLGQTNPTTGDVIQGTASQIQDPSETTRTLGSDTDLPAAGQDATAGGATAGVSLYDSPRAMFATTSARVRSGPGTGHAPVGTVPLAGEVAVLGEAAGGDWVYLEMGDGTRGFTAASLLSAARPTASSAGSTDSTGSSTTTLGGGSSGPACVSGQVLIDMGDGTAICATLQ